MKLEPSDKLPETAEGREAFTRFRDAVKRFYALRRSKRASTSMVRQKNSWVDSGSGNLPSE
jgi:hypothetical protein